MNAVEYLDYLAERQASAPPRSLRAALYGTEGIEATDDAINRGLHAWAVEAWRTDWRGVEYFAGAAIVFGRSRSDALRRARTSARLGEADHGEQSRAAVIRSGWDEPVAWPVAR